MTQTLKHAQEYYGTVAHWFNHQKIGSIRHDSQSVSENILLIAEHLPEFYVTPKVGDEVRYRVSKDENNRLYATSIEPLAPLRGGSLIRITVKMWDMKNNGGYGIYGVRQTPVFALGLYLNDRTRIPEAGDVLQGYLAKHENQHWMLTDIGIIDKLDQRHQEIEESEEAARLAADRQYAGSNYAGRVYAARKQQTAPLQVATKMETQTKDNLMFPAFTPLKGQIVSWDESKGFGSIQSGIEGKEVFFHLKAFHYSNLKPKEGLQVSFYCNKPISDAKQQAVRVVLREDEEWLYCDQPQEVGSGIKWGQLMLCIPVAAVYLYWVSLLSWKLAAIYLVISLFAIMLYGYDKMVAKKNRLCAKCEQKSRMPENILYLTGILGGWPGGLLAQSLFHHKTRKQQFIMMFWLIALVNAAVTYGALVRFVDEPMLKSFLLLLKN
ncbi:MAG: DUF1294 domain-containing protein [Neisseria sp.]|uniref:DUF1294 domain-containing protein n=1 Tax=Neisseria sp. TaxID=192066 RepID=UPI0026DCE808|nr:DUF1294 domain-containing protein [Neisseria sp.]MDO4642169.1 DUF1294 domain-containing protein [Neisseria sp.]